MCVSLTAVPCYRTPLHIACACGHMEVVQFLLECKAKLNLCDNQNRSALMKVILAAHTDTLQQRYSVRVQDH